MQRNPDRQTRMSEEAESWRRCSDRTQVRVQIDAIDPIAVFPLLPVGPFTSSRVALSILSLHFL